MITRYSTPIFYLVHVGTPGYHVFCPVFARLVYDVGTSFHHSDTYLKLCSTVFYIPSHNQYFSCSSNFFSPLWKVRIMCLVLNSDGGRTIPLKAQSFTKNHSTVVDKSQVLHCKFWYCVVVWCSRRGRMDKLSWTTVYICRRCMCVSVWMWVCVICPCQKFPVV